MSLFTTIQVYEQDGAIVFKDPAELEPFAAFPKGSIKVRNYGISGFLFEREVDSANIAFVEEADDVLDSTAAPYGVTRALVYDLLYPILSTTSILEDLSELASFDMIPGNNINITYYPGIDVGNPSGNTNNIYTIVYTTGMTVIATKTLSYNAADNVISVITT
jgi:hypothetical protein